MTGVHRCVRLKTQAMKNRADTSVCPYGKYNVIRTFVGAHRCVRPSMALCFHLGRHIGLHLRLVGFFFFVGGSIQAEVHLNLKSNGVPPFHFESYSSINLQKRSI